jgi:hypothetical protein
MSFVHTWEGEAQLILKIIVKVQGADLRRFDKHKIRATLWTGWRTKTGGRTMSSNTERGESLSTRWPKTCAGGLTDALDASSSTATISLMIVMMRCALKELAHVCPALTTYTRVVS